MKSIGIDLAGKESNPPGVAVLEDKKIETNILHSNIEIIEMCEGERPDIIAIDAPLSFPEESNLKEADSELIKMGYQVLPPTLGRMESLTERGIDLSDKLRELGFRVIEIHPRTSGKVLFDSESRGDWISKLMEGGWEIDSSAGEHEIDSALAALTASLHMEEKTEEVGKKDKIIVIPSGVLKSL